MTREVRTYEFTPGKAIGRYSLLHRLGTGGFGEVYLAVDEHLRREVAIKFLLPELRADIDARSRFMRGAHIAATLSHPHSCTIYDVVDTSDLTFIVMEYIDGVEITSWARAEQVSLRKLLTILSQAAEALGDAHTQGYVHRDITPNNILIDRRGFAKLVDFGLAKATGPVEPHDNTPRHITTTATMIGTPNYMAPEQIRGHEADARTDIYGFGAVIYHILTGVPPYDGSTTTELLEAILTQNAPDPIARNPRIPLELATVIRKCLEKRPPQRFATTSELLSALQSLDRVSFIDTPIVGSDPSLQEHERAARSSDSDLMPSIRFSGVRMSESTEMLVEVLVGNRGLTPRRDYQLEVRFPTQHLLGPVLHLYDESRSSRDSVCLVYPIGTDLPASIPGNTTRAVVKQFLAPHEETADGQRTQNFVSVLLRAAGANTPAFMSTPIPATAQIPIDPRDTVSTESEEVQRRWQTYRSDAVRAGEFAASPSRAYCEFTLVPPFRRGFEVDAFLQAVEDAQVPNVEHSVAPIRRELSEKQPIAAGDHVHQTVKRYHFVRHWCIRSSGEFYAIENFIEEDRSTVSVDHRIERLTQTIVFAVRLYRSVSGASSEMLNDLHDFGVKLRVRFSGFKGRRLVADKVDEVLARHLTNNPRYAMHDVVEVELKLGGPLFGTAPHTRFNSLVESISFVLEHLFATFEYQVLTNDVYERAIGELYNPSRPAKPDVWKVTPAHRIKADAKRYDQPAENTPSSD